MSENLLNTKEAADYLGIKETKLKELVRKKIIPAYKIGGAYVRFKRDQLNIARARIQEPTKRTLILSEASEESKLEKARDFLYFNDFYILSVILVALALFVIFTP